MAYTDTFLVEKLREILLRLYPTPQTSPVILPKTNTNQFGEKLDKISEGDLYEGELEGEEGANLIGTVHNLSSFDHIESNFVQGNYTTKQVYDTTALTRNLHEFIQVLKMSLSPGVNGGAGGGSGSGGLEEAARQDLPIDNKAHSTKDLEFNLTMEDILDLNSLLDGSESTLQFKHVLIILVYFVIAFVAIVGNLLVVQLVIRSRRLHTLTHALLANLAVSDLFMATLNIPFSAARVILAEWPFGPTLCHLVPFVQVTSVYVTSITMAVIAFDRYSVIMNPLGTRMKSSHGVILVLIIWILSAFLSLPYAIHHKVVRVLTVGVVQRCQAEFGSIGARRWLTVGTFFAQYLFPLIFTSISYSSIMRRLGDRSNALGSTTPRQIAAQSRAKKKTIKMLALTVAFFAVAWAPINLYHLLTHFSLMRHNSTVILVCHIIAMSSSTINPFIYCGLNEQFRLEAQKWMRCFRTRRCPIVHPRVEVNGTLTRADRGGCLRQSPHQQSRTDSTTFAQSYVGGKGSFKGSPHPLHRNLPHSHSQPLSSCFSKKSPPFSRSQPGNSGLKTLKYGHSLYHQTSPLVEVRYNSVERPAESLFLVHSSSYQDILTPQERKKENYNVQNPVQVEMSEIVYRLPLPPTEDGEEEKETQA